MSGFKGRYISTLDAKGRVAVPAKLRRVSSDLAMVRFVVTLGLDGCLFLFPPEQWQRVVDRLDEHGFMQRKAKYFTRVIMPNAEDVELDRQSRIRIPQHLIEAAHLEREVLFLGVLRRIELWRPEAYQTYLQEFDSSYEQVAEELLL